MNSVNINDVNNWHMTAGRSFGYQHFKNICINFKLELGDTRMQYFKSVSYNE